MVTGKKLAWHVRINQYKNQNLDLHVHFTKKLKRRHYFKIKPLYSIPIFQGVDFSQVLLYGSLQTSISNIQGFLFLRLCLIKYFPFFFFFMESFFILNQNHNFIHGHRYKKFHIIIRTVTYDKNLTVKTLKYFLKRNVSLIQF